jgi:mitochondrial fission protein ELM1
MRASRRQRFAPDLVIAAGAAASLLAIATHK